jgi:hypothetical protein
MLWSSRLTRRAPHETRTMPKAAARHADGGPRVCLIVMLLQGSYTSRSPRVWQSKLSVNDLVNEGLPLLAGEGQNRSLWLA